MNKRAFSLIELLISLIIIGVVSAMAVPVYKRYVTESKILEGFVVANQAKEYMTYYYLKNNAMPYTADLARELNSTNISGNEITLNNKANIFSVTYTRDSQTAAYLTITLNFDVVEVNRRNFYVGGKADYSTGSIKWKCGAWNNAAPTAYDINDLEYLPKGCDTDNVFTYLN